MIGLGDSDATVEIELPLQERLSPDISYRRPATAPLDLELVRRLPEVCAPHGRPSVRWEVGYHGFQERGSKRYLSTFRGFLLSIFHVVQSFTSIHSGTDTRVFGAWPVCARCDKRARRWRWVGRAFVFAGLPLLIAIAGIRLRGDFPPAPLVFAFFPMWLPFGLLYASSAYRRAKTFVEFLPMPDTDKLRIRAHPTFAAAVAQR